MMTNSTDAGNPTLKILLIIDESNLNDLNENWIYVVFFNENPVRQYY